VTPELKLEGVRFRLYRGDTLRASGTAARVSLRRDSTELTARNLSAVLPGAPGAPASERDVRIAAPAGQGVVRARTFAATGGVTVAQGRTIARTPTARYEPSPAGGLVRGDEPVVVEGDGHTIRGDGFVLDPAAGEIAIHGAVALDAAMAGSR
jgi:lipopolysaccharide export system protein LptC